MTTSSRSSPASSVGPVRRQCWVVFLDDRARPVPFLLPVSDLPWQPDEHVEDFAALVADVRDDASAARGGARVGTAG